MPPMPDPTSIASLCDDLAAEHAVLDCIVSDLSDEQWLLATPAEPWTIRDQIAHLAYFDERAVEAATRPEEFAAHVATVAADIESTMERHLELGGRDGPATLEHWRSVRAAMLGVLRRLDPEGRVLWYGPAMSASSFITARLMETWAHGQDVADALGIERAASTRLRHVAFLGVRTFAWSHQVRGLPVPDSPPRVEL
ncbi:MAG: maleylpyruvate isomerase family mycothiol-dependent enzyme, partial [Actinobacteria bacterium]